MTEQEQYHEAMEAMFASAGWKLLLGNIADWQAAISSQWRTLKPETLGFEQGRYDGLNQIATFEDMLVTLKAAAVEDSYVAT
jgi:hypothetical protein